MNSSTIAIILETLDCTRTKFTQHYDGYEFTYDSNGYPATEIVKDIDDLSWVLNKMGVCSQHKNTPIYNYRRFIRGDRRIVTDGIMYTMRQTPEYFECNGHSCYEKTLPKHEIHRNLLRWRIKAAGYAGIYCEQFENSEWKPVNYIIIWSDISKIISAEQWPRYNCAPMKYARAVFPFTMENGGETYSTPAHMPRTDRTTALEYIISGGATPKPGTITELTVAEYREYLAETAKRNSFAPIAKSIGEYTVLIRSVPAIRPPSGPVYDNEVE